MKRRKIQIPEGIEKRSIMGRRFPIFVLTWSERKPHIGFMRAFQTAPIAEITPETAGSTPATVVKKNIRYVPIALYAIESPTDAVPYPSFSLTLNFPFMVMPKL